jgi:hypothetical protein
MPANQYMDAAKDKCHLRRVGMTYQRAKLEVVRQNSGVFSEVFSQTKKVDPSDSLRTSCLRD